MEFSHAGMTAEGDNSVLMQKVTKELMSDLRKGEVELPQMTLCPKRQLPDLLNLNDLNILENLLIWREAHLIEKLTNNMMQKVMKEGRSLFEVWMGALPANCKMLWKTTSEKQPAKCPSLMASSLWC